MKTYSMPLGRTMGYEHPHPERTASKHLYGVFGDIVFQIWPNRESMARSIRMQQSRASRPDDWNALIKLTDGEGY